MLPIPATNHFVVDRKSGLEKEGKQPESVGDADSHFPSFNARIARIQSSAPLKASGLASGHVSHGLS